MKATYVKRDLCPCGHGVLKDDVPIGKVYEVNPSDVIDAILICGGCGKSYKVRAIKVTGPDEGVKRGYLPLGILSLGEAHA